MRFETKKNFFTQEECAALNAWVDLAAEKKWLGPAVDSKRREYAGRVTSRFYSDRFEYPPIVALLTERIRVFCGVANHPLIAGHGQNGVVVSCTFPGGDVYAHKDGKGMGGLATLRCNVITRAADAGGALHIEGQSFGTEAGELHCYLASEHEHFVSAVEGGTSRVLWMFGAHVPAEDWNSGKIKFGEA